MLPVRKKAFGVFDFSLAAIDGVLVLVYLALFFSHNLPAAQLGISIYGTIIGGAHVVYVGSLYRVLKRRSLVGASLIGTLLFSTNMALLILGSGGFRSPFYPLWLMLTLAIGIYRPSIPLGLLGLSTAYFGGYVITQNPPQQLVTNSSISLLATYITGGLGFWLWHSHHTQAKRAADLSQLSERLTQEQLKSEILLNHIGDGVVVVDTNLEVQLLNPAGSALTGWTAGEAKGIDSEVVLRLLDEAEKPLKDADNVFSQAMASGQVVTRDDVVLHTRSDKKLAISITISPVFDRADKVSGAIAVFRDISAAKTAERQRNEFISTASHEMRTPVAAVEGYISLALNPKVANVDAAARQYLQKAQASTQHLGKLFQDLLSITRIEEGRLPSSPEVVDANALIAQVIDELRFKAEKKQLNLSFQGVKSSSSTRRLGPLYYVYADPERLREVLVNLVDNAIKFTDSGGVELTLEGDRQTVTMGVSDSGPGIAPEDMPHLFQKFYRVSTPATERAGGTGLGLYITRAIVEMYQGRIWVESAAGRGSHFKFSLPRLSYAKAQALLRAAAQARAAAPAPPPPRPANPQTFVASAAELKVE